MGLCNDRLGRKPHNMQSILHSFVTAQVHWPVSSHLSLSGLSNPQMVYIQTSVVSLFPWEAAEGSRGFNIGVRYVVLLHWTTVQYCETIVPHNAFLSVLHVDNLVDIPSVWVALLWQIICLTHAPGYSQQRSWRSNVQLSLACPDQFTDDVCYIW